MSAGWVAGAIRARALASRCTGPDGARELARTSGLDEALRLLAGTPYHSRVRAAASLPAAQRAVAATLLWHLRVLAGWLPRGGVTILRPLAAGFEIANVAARLRPSPAAPAPAPTESPPTEPPHAEAPRAGPAPGEAADGEPATGHQARRRPATGEPASTEPPYAAPADGAGTAPQERGTTPPAYAVTPVVPPYDLGALATAWRGLSRAGTRGALRAALTASSWGDPGDETPAAILTSMRLTAALHTAAAVPGARRWAAGRAALLTARERFVHGRAPAAGARRGATAVLGARAVNAASWADFRRALPPAAAWVVAGVDAPADLWRAELRWWHTLEADGRSMAHTVRHDATAVVGAVAVLSADAWAVRAALALAARGGARPEVLDALV
ncbi:hypothetical protein ACF1A5_04325 [Streptomyces sp. NPDC014864]|uniref:hypothetical protein n=1 Tax=Streptomyces sp. NPDC014864 TaxID=3364924 RepID=UPI0037034121